MKSRVNTPYKKIVASMSVPDSKQQGKKMWKIMMTVSKILSSQSITL
jgi:hypothetical protein